MDIDLGEINYLAVIVGIIISMAGRALWYSSSTLARPVPVTFRSSSVSSNPLVESTSTMRLPHRSSTTTPRPIWMSKGGTTTLPPALRIRTAAASAELDH